MIETKFIRMEYYLEIMACEISGRCKRVLQVYLVPCQMKFPFYKQRKANVKIIWRLSFRAFAVNRFDHDRCFNWKQGN